jgi:hypothetical protein
MPSKLHAKYYEWMNLLEGGLGPKCMDYSLDLNHSLSELLYPKYRRITAIVIHFAARSLSRNFSLLVCFLFWFC